MGGRANHGAGVNPAAANTCWPCGPVTRSTNFVARAGWVDAVNVAIGYTFTTAAASGKSTWVTLSPAFFASVTYTSPASACPLVTFPSTSVTEFSSLTGVKETPVLDSTFAAAAPHGTCGAQTTTSTP